AIPIKEPIASPSGPVWVTIRTRCALATSALASLQSISVLPLFGGCLGIGLRREIERVQQAIDPLTALYRHVPVKMQHGHVPQPHALRQLAPQEPTRAREPGHHFGLVI